MKQKFAFEKDLEKGIVILSESAEIDPGTFMTLHKEEYQLLAMIEAGEKGQETFVDMLRRKNLFPTFDLAVKLFEMSVPFLRDESETKFLVEYSDVEAFPSAEEEAEVEEADESVEIDDLLDAKDDGDLSDDDIKDIDSEGDNISFKPEDNSEHEN